MIDHGQVRELLELAAVEQDGLERLWAGDTAEAAAVAGHLAGCPSCAEEARRLAAVAAIVRDSVAGVPADDLRTRTLLLVRSAGRPRGAAASLAGAASVLPGLSPASLAGAASVLPGAASALPGSGPATPSGDRIVPTIAAAAEAAAPADTVAPEDRKTTASPTDLAGAMTRIPPAGRVSPVPASLIPAATRRRRFAWPIALAASIAIALVAGGVVGDSMNSRQLEDARASSSALEYLGQSVVRIMNQPDGRIVALTQQTSSTDPHSSGLIVFAPSTRELAMSATGLPTLEPGQQFSCWLQAPDGTRTRMGTLRSGDVVSFWAGWSDALATFQPGTAFGITRVDAGGHPVGPDLLVGTATSL